IFIGFSTGRIEISQPATVISSRCWHRPDADVGSAPSVRKRRLHNFVRSKFAGSTGLLGVGWSNPLSSAMTSSAMTASRTAEITGLYRYPVKGLTPEPLPRVTLRVGQTLPADRRYAIENGPSGFDPKAPEWKPKSQFLMLMR